MATQYRAWAKIVHPTTGASHIVECAPRDFLVDAQEDLADCGITGKSSGGIEVREVSPWRDPDRKDTGYDFMLDN